MSFCSVLGVVFIVLKILKIITWPWIWVLSPIWIGVIIDLIAIELYFRN